MKSKIGVILDPLEEGVAVEKRINSKRVAEIHSTLRQKYHLKNSPADKVFAHGFIEGKYYGNYITRDEYKQLLTLFGIEP